MLVMSDAGRKTHPVGADRPVEARKGREERRQEERNAAAFGVPTVPTASPPSILIRPFGLEDVRI